MNDKGQYTSQLWKCKWYSFNALDKMKQKSNWCVTTVTLQEAFVNTEKLKLTNRRGKKNYKNQEVRLKNRCVLWQQPRGDKYEAYHRKQLQCLANYCTWNKHGKEASTPGSEDRPGVGSPQGMKMEDMDF